MRKRSSDQLSLIEGFDNTVEPVHFDKPVSLIHIANKITNHQRKCYNALLSRAKIAFEARGDYDSDLPVVIPWREFREVLFLKHRTRAYAKEKIEELMSTVVEIDCLGRESLPKKLTLLQLLGETSFVGEGEDMYIEMHLPKTIRERLRDSDVTAVLDLSQMSRLDSKYSTPLYELGREALEDSGGEPTTFRLAFDDFKKLLGIESEYPRVYDLVNRCIDPAIAEIIASTDLRLSYTLIRSGVGRKLVAIEFSVRVGEKRDPERVRFVMRLNEALHKVRKGFQEHKQVVKAVEDALKDHDNEYVISNIEYANKHAKTNYIKFLKDALADDYGVQARANARARIEAERQKEENERKRLEQLQAFQKNHEETMYKEIDEKLKSFFESLSEDEKQVYYAKVEAAEMENPFVRKMAFDDQLLHVLRMEGVHHTI